MTIIEYESETVRKKSGAHASEKRLYVSSLPTSTPALGSLVRNHWSIESMHWALDFNLLQDRIKRKFVKKALFSVKEDEKRALDIFLLDSCGGGGGGVIRVR